MKSSLCLAALAAAIASAGLYGCGGAATTSPAASSHSASPGSTYPDHAADSALCTTYNTDITSDDPPDIQTAVQQAVGSVSLKLAKDIEAVVNSDGTEQQDELALIKVAEDCALVKVGKSPGG